MPQVRRDAKVAAVMSEPVAGRARIDVELQIVFEEPAERFENAALEIRVVFLVEELLRSGRP